MNAYSYFSANHERFARGANRALLLLELSKFSRHFFQLSFGVRIVDEIPHLAGLVASTSEKGEVVIGEAALDKLPRTKVIVLEQGRIAFSGTVAEFKESDEPAIRELMSLDRHDHSKDPYFIDPWDKRRRPAEKLL